MWLVEEYPPELVRNPRPSAIVVRGDSERTFDAADD